jgi:isopenicillin N synthase-like dioxygenase
MNRVPAFLHVALSQTVLEYQQQMEVLGQTLLRGISMSLGLEPEFFEQK